MRGSFLPASANPGSISKDRLQVNVQDAGNQLGHLFDIGEGDIQRAANVFDGGARAERIERDDLRDLLAAVLLGDVLDHFAAAVHAEIDVDIGHAHALRIEKAFEEQAVLQRIDIGDLHGVADQAARGRTATRADRDVDRFSRKRMKSQTIRK